MWSYLLPFSLPSFHLYQVISWSLPSLTDVSMYNRYLFSCITVISPQAGEGTVPPPLHSRIIALKF